MDMDEITSPGSLLKERLRSQPIIPTILSELNRPFAFSDHENHDGSFFVCSLDIRPTPIRPLRLDNGFANRAWSMGMIIAGIDGK
jgi:hypothetical protein